MLTEDRKSKGYSQFIYNLNLIKSYIALKLPKNLFGYSSEALVCRINQQITTEGLSGFMSKLDSKGGLSNNSNEKIVFGPFSINLEKKSLIVSYKIYFKSLVLFMALWVGSFVAFTISFIFSNNFNCKSVLIYGVPLNLRRKNVIKNFESFCLGETESPFSEKVRYIVQSWRASGHSERIIYSKYPILKLLLISKFNFLDFRFFFREHFLVLLFFLFHSLKSHELSLLWRDFALHSSVRLLNRKKIITAFLLTNTQWSRQYLWMSDLHGRKFKTFMIPYSMNYSPLKFKKSGIVEYSPHPYIMQLRVDEIWVWSPEDIKELKKMNVLAQPYVKKPILWYPDLKLLPIKHSRFKITIFEVTPFNSETLANRGLNGNYYSCNTIQSFVKDIIEICSEISEELSIKIDIEIKQKRSFSKYHDQNYINFINRIVDEKRLMVIDHNENLFSIIRASDLIISIPFSSPAYIARAIGKYAIFYDPTDLILNDTIKNAGINFYSDKFKLKSHMIKLIKSFYKPTKNL